VVELSELLNRGTHHRYRILAATIAQLSDSVSVTLCLVYAP
jgi:hypothetical protein